MKHSDHVQASAMTNRGKAMAAIVSVDRTKHADNVCDWPL